MEQVFFFHYFSKNLSIYKSKPNLLQIFKPRKYTKLSKELLLELKVAFQKSHYPSQESLDEIAKESIDKRKAIKNWFRAERKKMFEAGGAMGYEVKIRDF